LGPCRSQAKLGEQRRSQVQLGNEKKEYEKGFLGFSGGGLLGLERSLYVSGGISAGAIANAGKI